MSIRSRVAALWRNLIHSRTIERDLDDEVRAVTQLLIDEHVRDGLEPRAAIRAAAIEIGGVEQVKERVREARAGITLDAVGRDIRHGLRGLRLNPVFSIVTIGTLALGIGANTALFSAVQSVLVRPLTFTDPDRLVMVWEDASFVGFPKNTPAPGNYLDWQRRNRVFADMAATRSQIAALSADGPPQQILGRAVTSNFFSLLGVQPMLGRTFTAAEDTAGEPVVIVSYRLWQARYNADPNLVGQRILFNGEARTTNATVIGIMPRDFVFRNREMDFWVPIHFSPADAATRDSHFLNVVARLKPGVSVASARDDMNRVARELATTYPDSNDRIGAVVIPIADEFLGDTRLELLVLAGAAGCVLLIACANLANLLLSRSVARRAELAMRAALGASQGRLVQQMLISGLLLALAGGTLGLVLAPLGTGVIAQLVPASLPEPNRSGLSLSLLAFTAALSILTGILFSLVPAWLAARRSQHDALRQTARTGSDRRGRRMSDVLVVAQVAVALVLLVGAGLMIRTLANLRAIDVGFQSDHLLTMRTSLPRERYADPIRRLAFYDRVVDSTAQLPGVTFAAYVSTLPFVERGSTNGYAIEGGDPVRPDQDALFRVATNDYLSTLGVRLLEGRTLSAHDLADAPKVVVINETFARRHWPAGGALGHRLTFDGPDGPWRTIVGVVEDVRERGYTMDMKPGVYLPFAQALTTWATPQYLVVRTAGDPHAVADAVRRVVTDADAQQPVTAVRTMDEIIDLDVADRRQQATLLGAFSILALLLAVLGLYGVLSHTVVQRQRDIGLRMALGASRGAILRSIVGRGLLLTLAGLTIGVGLAALASRALITLLYEVRALDATTYVGVSLLLLGIAAIASAVPAARAASVDPMQALRQD